MWPERTAAEEAVLRGLWVGAEGPRQESLEREGAVQRGDRAAPTHFGLLVPMSSSHASQARVN